MASQRLPLDDASGRRRPLPARSRDEQAILGPSMPAMGEPVGDRTTLASELLARLRTADRGGAGALLLSLQRSSGNQAVAWLLSGSPPSRPARIQRLAFIHVPAGPVPTGRNGDRLEALFEVQAELHPERLQPTRGEMPKDGEYRQMIKGEFTENGRPVETRLPYQQTLRKDTWKEDGTPTSYMGSRAKPNFLSHYYADAAFTDVNEKGPYYKGRDEPGPQVPPGHKATFDLTFRGELVDRKDGGKVLLQSGEWSVNGAWDRSSEAPPPQLAGKPVDWRASGKLPDPPKTGLKGDWYAYLRDNDIKSGAIKKVLKVRSPAVDDAIGILTETYLKAGGPGGKDVDILKDEDGRTRVVEAIRTVSAALTATLSKQAT